MTIEVLNIKQHDLQPYYRSKVVDSDGIAVDCTGASAVFTMVDSTGTIVINRSPNVTFTNAALGEMEYRWSGTDTDITGKYSIEFEVTPLTGGKFTVPVTEKAPVKIWPSLDDQ